MITGVGTTLQARINHEIPSTFASGNYHPARPTSADTSAAAEEAAVAVTSTIYGRRARSSNEAPYGLYLVDHPT